MGFYQYKTLWVGIYISDASHSLYFTGDSGYCSTFTEIYEKLGAPDIILADSGQELPSWSQMSFEEVIKVAQDVHAKYLIPVHWGTFMYSNFDWFKPVEDVVSQAESSGVSVVTPRIGYVFDFEDIASENECW